ncbi:MAG TPA: hypothetical protein PLG77_01990 [Burkholderiaceae bacterium]|nr:hypothetical protein [Burkholderiaceae bacterium]
MRQAAQPVVVVGAEGRARRLEHGLVRPAVRDLQQVGVEERQVAHQHAGAVADEAVVLRQRVGGEPVDADEPVARHRIFEPLRARHIAVERHQAKQLAPREAAAVRCAGGRVARFLDQQVLDARVDIELGRRGGLVARDAVEKVFERDRIGLAGAAGDVQVGARRTFGEGRDAVAPGVELQRVERGEHAASPARAGHARQREHHSVGVAPVAAAPHRPFVLHAARVVRQHGQVDACAERLRGDPGAGLVALVQVVVDQARMARERDALARADDRAFADHAIVMVGQFVALGCDQVDQHLVEVGLAGRLPARHALRHRGHQQVAEAVVVACEVVDRRDRAARRRGVEARRAREVEAAGAELERQAVQQRVHRARQRVAGGGDAGEARRQHVAAVVADRRDLQAQRERPAAGIGMDLGHLHLARQSAGADAYAASDDEGFARRQRGERLRVVELDVEPREARLVHRLERDVDEAKGVVARGGQVARTVGDAFFVEQRTVHGRLPGCCCKRTCLTSPVASSLYLRSTLSVASSETTSSDSTAMRCDSQRDRFCATVAFASAAATGSLRSNTRRFSPAPNDGRNGRSPGAVSSSCRISLRTWASSVAGAALRPSLPT